MIVAKSILVIPFVVGAMAGGSAAAQPSGGAAPSAVDPATAANPLSATAGQAGVAAKSPASPAGGGLQEVVVTAQRRSENLQKVPITVTAVTGAKLAAAGVQDTQDLSSAVPGLTFPSAQGTAQPHLRGVGSSIIAIGFENPVALYVDNVYYATPAGGILSLNNVAQIEVLKGPQGTLFGRNSTGGVIQISTRDPSQAFHGDASIGYGNYNSSSAEGYITGGLTSNLAADLAIQLDHQGDGFGKDFATGKDIYKADSNISARSKFLWKPLSATTVAVSLDFESSRTSQASLIQLPGSAARNLFYSATPSATTQLAYDANENSEPAYIERGGGASVRVTQDLGFAQLVNTTAYRRQRFFFKLDPDLGPLPYLNVASEQADKQVSEELQLQSERASKLQWTVGLFYFHASDTLTHLSLDFDGPARAQFAPGVFLVHADDYGTQDTDSVAGYLQATYPITSKTNVTVGGRVTYEEKSLDASQFGVLNAFGNISSMPFGAKNDSFSVVKPTWRVSIDQKITDDILGYISYNRGFKSGGFNIEVLDAPPYLTEKIDAYEIGLKTQLLNRRVRLNASGFYYSYDNLQVVKYENGVSDVFNGASAEIYGLDIDLDWAVTQKLTISGGLEAVHDSFTSFPCAEFYDRAAVGSPACTTSTAATLPYDQSAAGNKLPFTPTLSASLSLNYATPLFGGKADFNANDSYNSGFYSEPDNFLRQSAYNLLNASVRWSTSDDRYFVRVWTKNLSDERYVVQLSSSAVQLNYALAPPRTFGATIGAKF